MKESWSGNEWMENGRMMSHFVRNTADHSWAASRPQHKLWKIVTFLLIILYILSKRARLSAFAMSRESADSVDEIKSAVSYDSSNEPICLSIQSHDAQCYCILFRYNKVLQTSMFNFTWIPFRLMIRSKITDFHFTRLYLSLSSDEVLL